MKITKEQLKQIIKEELEAAVEEGYGSRGSWNREQRRTGQVSKAKSAQLDVRQRPSGHKTRVEGYEGIFTLETRDAPRGGGFMDVFAVNDETGEEVEVNINSFTIGQSSDEFGTAGSIGTVRPARKR
tara:strand:- start:1188 stop:1568 length:381 start_codon:yes stop_codon:yes gene_type:complete